jgi:regulatory protein
MNNPNNLHQTILTWLSRRDYSCHELTQKLKAKGYTPAEYTPIITELLASKLINESRFTENYIHWRRTKGYGPLRISLELQKRGIPQEMIAQHLQITDNAWLAEAHKVWQKRFKGHAGNDFNARAKQMRFLQYRGFTQEHIENVIDTD